ncbi:MAG: PaaI family thioesterase [Gammaproteobacteria bacterium]|nr:PaaI family thioesterase [Gammaproteobacteria bacterium]MCP5425609.1 PaaI family thioesterase [Gammaproteobacteria bacterium]MCP5458991.1 PaaI family thioesterase [Gammaproteobacteria bacterium]
MANDDEPRRSRLVTWQNPALATQAGRALSGLDYLLGVQNGSIPVSPFGRLLDYRIVEVRPGHARLELEPQEFHCNPTGTVHGGVLSTLLDSAMGCAVQATLAAGVAYATLEMKTNFTRPLRGSSPPVRCEAKTVHAGSRIVTAEGKVLDDQHVLYAHGLATFMIFKT